MSPTLQALLVADHIYQDNGSGKYVIAGTFHQIKVPAFPTTLSRTVGVFVCVSGVEGDVDVGLEFLDSERGEVLIRSSSFGFHCEDPALPVEFAVEIPPLPLPRPGHYAMRLAANGIVLGEAPVIVERGGQ